MTNPTPNPAPVAPKSNRVKAMFQRYFGSMGLHLLLTAISLSLILPFLWMLLTSSKALQEVGVGSWIPSMLGTVDSGQVSEDTFKEFREEILNGETALAKHLKATIDFQAKDLTRESLASQLTGRVIEGPLLLRDGIADDIPLSPETKERLELHGEITQALLTVRAEIKKNNEELAEREKLLPAAPAEGDPANDSPASDPELDQIKDEIAGLKTVGVKLAADEATLLEQQTMTKNLIKQLDLQQLLIFQI